MPPFLRAALEQGFLGVDVFFVLSGFVIPFSVRKAELTTGFLGRFAVRRSIRLDPPYWAAIALEVLLVWLGLRLALTTSELPTWPQFFSHLIYAQNIFGYGDIIDVFWTLCFEIQFYLGLIALLVAGHSLRRSLGEERTRQLAIVVFTVLFVISVLGRFQVFGITIHPGFALIRWFQFFMGTCVYWVIAEKTTWRPLVATWVFLGVVLLVERQSPLQLIPIATSGLLWWSWKRDRMATILSNRPVQFLGAISYSLYLFHATVGWRWIRLAGVFTGGDASFVTVLAIFASGCAVAIAVSWALWRLLEIPSMRLSKVVFRPTPR